MHDIKDEEFEVRFINIPLEMGDLKINFILPLKFLYGEEHLITLPHIHVWSEMHFIFRGGYQVVTDNKSYELEENDICIIPTNFNHCLEKETASTKHLNMLIKFSHIKGKPNCLGEYEYYSQIFESINDIIIIKSSNVTKNLLSDFLELFNDVKVPSIYVLKSKLLLAFIEITSMITKNTILEISEGSVKNELELGKTGKEIEERILKLEHFLFKNYKNNINIADVASYINLSESYAASFIKEQMGMPFSEVIHKMRMMYAKKIILSTETPLTVISEEIGYNSYNGFYMAFKNHFGISPNSLREKISDA